MRIFSKITNDITLFCDVKKIRDYMVRRYQKTRIIIFFSKTLNYKETYKHILLIMSVYSSAAYKNLL